MRYYSQIYSNLRLSSFAICWTESILCHSGHMNHKSNLPRLRRCGRSKGWFRSVHLVDRAPIYRSLVTGWSPVWLCISRDAMVVWYWQHPTSSGMNHRSMSEQSVARRLGWTFPTDEKWLLTIEILRVLPIYRWYTSYLCLAWPLSLVYWYKSRVIEMWLIAELIRNVNPIRKSEW